MLNLIVILAALAQGLVGLFVYQKKRDSLSNISFGLLSVASLAWALTNYAYTLNPTSPNALYIIRLVLFWVVLENTFFFIFARTYPANRINLSPAKLKILLIGSAFVALLTLSPFIFKSVTVSLGQSNPNPGPLIPLFMLHAVLTIGLGLAALIKKKKSASKQEKRQYNLILFASILNWVVVPITNFVITLVFHTTFFARVSPFYSLAFAIIIAYAIVSQKLFDIRAVVARSVTYLVLAGSIIVIYSIVLFGIVNVLFSGSSNEFLRQILSILLIVPLVLSFQSIRRFLDRISNRLFYRDSYDIQEVLNELGRILVAEIDLHKVLDGTRTVLSGALKSTFVEFVLFREDQPSFEYVQNKVLQASAKEFIHFVQENHGELLITEDLGRHSSLKHILDDSQIALSLKLKTQHQIVGYILFGEKLSGDIYSTQDKRLLKIVANELAIAIQNALRFDEIEKFNITLQQKVDEATHKLRQTNEKLKALDETKDEFISMASHQLRTPLTSVKGYISMVLEGDAGKTNDMQKKLLDQAFASSQRMVYLIADLLNVSRLRTGKFVIERKPTQLAEVIETEIAQLTATAKGRGLELTYNKPKDFPMLMLDETKIRQVIMNFADNAIYYTPSGAGRGHIQIGLEDKGSSVEFTVTDDGIGVPKDAQHHLFTKFYRAGNAQHARPDGTGLGLFMAKKVIVAQGGAIIFHSDEGKGSTFGFSFPKSQVKVPGHLAPKPKEITTVK